MFKHILVPLDGSELAETALPLARELARGFDAAVTLFSVARPPYLAVEVGGHAYTELLTDLRSQVRLETEQYLGRWQRRLQAEGRVVHQRIVEGEPVAELILDAVEDAGIDGIVMSTHGRGGVSRWVFGSVADKVLQQATVPVLLVRAQEQEGPEV